MANDQRLSVYIRLKTLGSGYNASFSETLREGKKSMTTEDDQEFATREAAIDWAIEPLTQAKGAAALRETDGVT